MERKLATVRAVAGIKPISGADKIETITIDGWHCVAKKDEFKVGDICIYLEIDSIVPAIPFYDFMAQRKYRVRTIKLRQQISQGLALPLVGNQIPSHYIPTYKGGDKLPKVKLGDDVTEILGIKKHLIKEEQQELRQLADKKKHNWFVRYMTRFSWFRILFKKKSKSFPNWLMKTDQERLQNMPWILRDKETIYWISEKIDYCLDGNTLIDTNKGKITIKKICEKKEKYKIASYNHFLNRIEYKKILNYSIRKNIGQWYVIALNNGKYLKVTGNHKIYCSNLDCYRKVEDLTGNEILLTEKFDNT